MLSIDMVLTMTALSPLATLEVVILTALGAVNDELASIVTNLLFKYQSVPFCVF